MGNVTKSQHYVWRKYLAAWTDNKNKESGRIHVLRKELRGTQERIEERKLTQVGCENYYYDISGFDSKSVEVLKQLISYMQRNNTIKLLINPSILSDANAQKDFIEKFVMCEVEQIELNNDFFDKICKKDLSFYEDSGQQRILDQMKKDIFRSILEQTEISQEKLLETVQNFFDQDWETPDSKYDFHEFFCMQYFRTPTVRNAMYDSIRSIKKQHSELEFIDENFYITMLSIYYSTLMALNLTQKFDTFMWVYENKTNVPFITGDCPIVVLSNKNDSKEATIFHYPISPQFAAEIIVCNKNSRFSQFKKNIALTIGPALVAIINNVNIQLAKNCHNEIYSNDKELLSAIHAKLVNVDTKIE